jgi:hypothetical protein
MFGLMAGSSPEESRAMEFFCYRAAHRISSFADPTFWLRVVGQLGSEPSIRKSIVACSVVYEKAESGSPAEAYANDRMILIFYNKAIRSLTSPNRIPIHVALIACVLFICLEFLRGNIRGSIIHSRSGLKLIQDMRKQGNFEQPTGSDSDGSDIVEELEPIFSRLSLQSTLFGKFASQESISTPEDSYRPAAELFDSMHVVRNVEFDLDTPTSLVKSDDVFTSVEQAKLELFLFFHDAHGFGVKTFAAKYQMEITKDQRREHAAITDKFQKWRKAFARFLERNQQSLSPPELTAAKVLQVYSRSSYVWIASCLEPTETTCDRFKAEFEDIVNLSEEIIKDYFSSEPHDSSRIFVSNLSIIPPLHLTSWKCRWPTLRRRAIRLLSSRHWREGLFDSYRSARCFERVAQIEESAVALDDANAAAPSSLPSAPTFDDGYPTPSDSDRSTSLDCPAAQTTTTLTSPLVEKLPPEWARVHHVEFDFEHNTYPNMQKLVFYSKPYGPYGEWRRREESILLRGNVELGATSML